MSETPENVNDSAPKAPKPKKTWHAPTLEETSYTDTEVAGPPGAIFDGYGVYSAP